MTSFELGLVLLSAALHAGWSVVIKGSRDPVAFNWLQMAPAAVVAALLIAAAPAAQALPARFWWIAAAAGVSHGLYMYWMGRAFAVGDLALVYPIARSTPAFLPFAAAPLLGERITAAGGMGIATVVVGMWLVQTNGQLRLGALASRGAFFAWLTLLATVAYGLTDKAAMSELDAAAWEGAPGRAIFYFFLTTLGGAVVLTPLAFWSSGARGIALVARTEFGRVGSALLFSLVGYSLILEALRGAEASYVVTVRQASVIFAVALGVLLLHERPSRARLLGTFITVLGVVLVGVAG